jgi:hypothetical protein
MSTNSGEPDISRLLGGGPAAEDLTGEPRRRRRARKGIDVTPIPDSEMRLRILDRLNTMHMQAFDQWTEQLVKAMLAVLDYHRPWRRAAGHRRLPLMLLVLSDRLPHRSSSSA